MAVSHRLVVLIVDCCLLFLMLCDYLLYHEVGVRCHCKLLETHVHVWIHLVVVFELLICKETVIFDLIFLDNIFDFIF